MRTMLIATALLAWMGPTPARAEQEASTEKDIANQKNRTFDFWMDLKLKESQTIFAALATADYSTIVESTEGLKALSSLEGFVRRSTPGYRIQLRSFEYALEEMRKQAKAQNIEGVALGFHQMTLSCVNCHKAIRRSKGQDGPQRRNQEGRKE